MPPRGNEGLDFTPIATHYVFLVTTVLAVIGWFVAFIGQIISTSRYGNVRVLWFAIFLQLFLIVGVVYTLASDSIAMHRFQIATFGAIAIVFAVMGVDQGIYSPLGAQNAFAAGYLLLAIVDIIWVLYFTSEEDSLMLHIFNSSGTGGLTPPSRRRRTRAQSVHNMNNGYVPSYASGGGIGPQDMQIQYDKSPTAVRSHQSFAGEPGATTRSLGGGTSGGAPSLNNAPLSAGVGSARDPDTSVSSPLMGTTAGPISPGNPSSQDGTQPTEPFTYRARALYAYTASPDDPNEISFAKGEVLDILDKQGKWWQAKRADGTVGIAPSNYLQVL